MNSVKRQKLVKETNLNKMKIIKSKVCRMCLSEVELIDVSRPITIGKEILNIPEIFRFCTDLKFEWIDNLPKKICQTCIAELFKFNIFKRTAKINDKKLRDFLINNDGSKTKEFDHDYARERMDLTQLDPINFESDMFDSTPGISSSSETNPWINKMNTCNRCYCKISESNKSSDKFKSDWDEIKNDCQEILEALKYSAKLDKVIEKGQKLQNPNSKVENITTEIENIIVHSETNELQHKKTKKLKRKTQNIEMEVPVDPDCIIVPLQDKSDNFKIDTENADDLGLVISNVQSLNETDPNLVFCKICKIYFESEVDLEEHNVFVNHSVDKPKRKINRDADKPKTCHRCLQDFPTFKELCVHRENSVQCKSTKGYTCTICDKKLETLSKYDSHVFEHTGEKTYKCNICEKSYVQLQTYKNHMRCHKGSPYQCQHCTKSYANPTALKTHISYYCSMIPENKFRCLFSCEKCGKGYKSSANLYTHQKFSCQLIERNPDCKPKKRPARRKIEYLCSDCGHIFMSRSGLEKHQNKLHARDIPIDSDPKYSCDLCEETFTSESLLNKHILIHRGFLPYTCEVCDKRFRFQTHFENHKKVHTGEKSFICEVCDKAFRLKGNLVQHLQIHTGIYPFTCSFCDKGFNKKMTMLKHKIRYHMNNEEIYSENEFEIVQQ